MPIRVLIVDDHAGVRKLLRSLLKKATDIEVIGEAKNGSEAINQVSRLNPDVMLLDIEMPGMSGIEVAKELKARKINVVILAISAYNDRQYIFHMLNTGAAGYLVKDEVPNNLIPAIREVAGGKQGWITTTQRPQLEARKTS
jgi:DNA-binding NarL/FixJ family response regulator